MMNWLSSIGNKAPQIEHLDASKVELDASTTEEVNKQQDGHKILPSTTISELDSAITNKEEVADGKVCVIEKESDLNEGETDLTNIGYDEEENKDRATGESNKSESVNDKPEVKCDKIDGKTVQNEGKNDMNELEDGKAEGKDDIVEGEKSGVKESAISITTKECSSSVEESTKGYSANLIDEGRGDGESAKSHDEQEKVEKVEAMNESPNDETSKKLTEPFYIQEGLASSVYYPKGENKEVDKTEANTEIDGNEVLTDGKEITAKAEEHLGDKRTSAMAGRIGSASEDPDYSTSGIEGNIEDQCKPADVQDRLEGDIEEKQQVEGNGEARMMKDISAEGHSADNTLKEKQPTGETVYEQKAKTLIADDSENSFADPLVKSKSVKTRADFFEESASGSLDSTAGTAAILESRSPLDDVAESSVTVTGGDESNITLDDKVAEDERIAVVNAERKRINRQHHLMKEIVKIQQDRDAYEKQVQATGQKTSSDTSQPKEEVADNEAKQDSSANASGAAISFVKETRARDTQRKRSHGSYETSHERGVTRGVSDWEGKGGSRRGMTGARPSLSATAPSHGGRINRLDGGDRRNKVRPKEKPVEDSGGFMRGMEKNSQRRAVDSRVNVPHMASGTESKAHSVVSQFDSTPPASFFEETSPAGNRGSRMGESSFGGSRADHLARKSVHDHRFGENESVRGNLHVGLKVTFDTASSERRIELAGSHSVGVTYGHVPAFTPPPASTFIPGTGFGAKPGGNVFGGQSSSSRGSSKAQVGDNTERGWAGKWPPPPRPLHGMAGNEAGLFEFGVNRRQANNGGFEREANNQPPSNSNFQMNQNFEDGAIQNSHAPIADDRWQKGNVKDVRSVNKQSGRQQGPGELSRPFGSVKTGSEHGGGFSGRNQTGPTGAHKAPVQNIGSQAIGGISSRTTPGSHFYGAPSFSGSAPPVYGTSARSPGSILGVPPTGGRKVDDGPSSFLGEWKTGTDRGGLHQETSGQRGVIGNVSTQDWRLSKGGISDHETAGNSLQQESRFLSDTFGSRSDGPSSFNEENSGSKGWGSDGRFVEESNNRGRDFSQRQDARVRDEHGSGRRSVFERLGIPLPPKEGVSTSGPGSGFGRGQQHVNPVPLREVAPPLGGGIGSGRGGQQPIPKPASGSGNGIGRGQRPLSPTQLREGLQPLGGNGFGRGGQQATPTPAREGGTPLAGGNGMGRVQQQGASQFSGGETQYNGPGSRNITDADARSQPFSFSGFAGGTNATSHRQFAAGRGRVGGRGRSQRNFSRAVEGGGFREEKGPTQKEQHTGVRTGPSSDGGGSNLSSKSSVARKEASDKSGDDGPVVTSEVNITNNGQVDSVKGSSSRPESKADVDAVVLQAYGDAKTRRSTVELYIPRRGTTEPVT